MIKNAFAVDEIQILKSLGKNEEELIRTDLEDYIGYDELSVVDDKHRVQSIEDKIIRAKWRR